MTFETAAFVGMGAILIFGLAALVLGLLTKSKQNKEGVTGRHAH